MIILCLLFFIWFVIVAGGIIFIDLGLGMWTISRVKWFNNHPFLQFIAALLIGILYDLIFLFWLQNH